MATEMLNAGVPLPVVGRRLDHQRPSTTLNFYAQAVPGGDAHAAATLEAVLAGGGRAPIDDGCPDVGISQHADDVRARTADDRPGIR